MTLLQVVQLPRAGIQGTPLFVEIPVHAESAPYLVTSNKGPLWIEAPMKDGIVRSAMLQGNWKREVPKLYLAMVLEIRRRGTEDEWGNSFPNTPEGEEKAYEYMESFTHDGIEHLDRESRPRSNGVLQAKNTWIPDNTSILVPSDRSYLGIVGVWDDNTYTAIIHNPSRGMAVLGDW